MRQILRKCFFGVFYISLLLIMLQTIYLGNPEESYYNFETEINENSEISLKSDKSPSLNFKFNNTIGTININNNSNNYNNIESNNVHSLNNINFEPANVFRKRREILDQVCESYDDFYRPEYHVLHKKPKYPGREIVYLPGSPPVSVCIPHKVGSHAWGVFSRLLNKQFPGGEHTWRTRVWEERGGLRAVVVRNPLERLVSAYRMIFEDYCDPTSKFIRSKKALCSKKGISRGVNPLEKARAAEEAGGSTSLAQILKVVQDEYLHGGDRYISRIWYKFHPEPVPSDAMFKFKFKEFVRFLVNGSIEFEDDPYVLKHTFLSYHWAPFWDECPTCHPLVKPDFILHMETLEQDVENMLGVVRLSNYTSQFPHTHKQSGLSSARQLQKFINQISTKDLGDLIEKYRLDFELYGYSTEYKL